MPERRGATKMDTEKCPKCGGTEFTEATDYMPIKPSKMALAGSNKIYSFCLDCGHVASVRIENPSLFRKKKPSGPQM
jgi:predicted nucleic-acid-binding Zn-ribbon protein